MGVDMNSDTVTDNTKTVILIIGTADTKADELLFLKGRVEAAGALGRITK